MTEESTKDVRIFLVCDGDPFEPREYGYFPGDGILVVADSASDAAIRVQKHTQYYYDDQVSVCELTGDMFADVRVRVVEKVRQFVAEIVPKNER